MQSENDFVAEPIPHSPKRKQNLALIRQMRKLAPSSPYSYYGRTPEVFYRQACLMADYEDDVPWPEDLNVFPLCYQSLSDRQLRGYFSWRSWVRSGCIEPAPLLYSALYFYELLNQIGCSTPLEAYDKMRLFVDTEYEWSFLHRSQFQHWMHDFVIYHGLDASLLPPSSQQNALEQSVLILYQYQDHDHQTLFQALCSLSSYRLDNSRFYKIHPAETVEAVYQVYAALWEFHSKNRKKDLISHLIGQVYESEYPMFSGAIVYEQTPHTDTEYIITPLHRFRCQNGHWTRARFFPDRSRSLPLGELLRQIDYCMRQAYGMKSTLKPGKVTKAYQAIIDQVLKDFLQTQAQQKQAEATKTIRIDLSKLQGIRNAAQITQQKLIVEEELEESAPTPPSPPAFREATAIVQEDAATRLLHNLLRGESYHWIRQEGLLLSVLVDEINERYYDEFADTVLDFDGEQPVLIADYIDDLKGIIGE